MSTSSIDILCLNHKVQEDLTFPDQLARYLGKWPDRPPTVVLLGSGEDVELRMRGIQPGESRKNGCLQVDQDTQLAFLEGMRDTNRKVVARLNDAGLSVVGFTAEYRSLFVQQNGRVEAHQPEAFFRWTELGVVPVISCCIKAGTGITNDLHPALAASSLCSFREARMVWSLARLPGEFVQTTSWNQLLQQGLIDQEDLRIFDAALRDKIEASSSSAESRSGDWFVTDLVNIGRKELYKIVG